MADDWRREHLRTQSFLRGTRWRKKVYKAYSPTWDHDHCVGCWAKFSERPSSEGQVEREGFAITADYKNGEDYEWVCLTCFALFKDEMEWVEVLP